MGINELYSIPGLDQLAWPGLPQSVGSLRLLLGPSSLTVFGGRARTVCLIILGCRSSSCMWVLGYPCPLSLQPRQCARWIRMPLNSQPTSARVQWAEASAEPHGRIRSFACPQTETRAGKQKRRSSATDPFQFNCRRAQPSPS